MRSSILPCSYLVTAVSKKAVYPGVIGIKAIDQISMNFIKAFSDYSTDLIDPFVRRINATALICQVCVYIVKTLVSQFVEKEQRGQERQRSSRSVEQTTDNYNLYINNGV
jgi:hypothetical protein